MPSVSLPLGSSFMVELVPAGLEKVGASSLFALLKYDGGSASWSRELLDGVEGLDMAKLALAQAEECVGRAVRNLWPI